MKRHLQLLLLSLSLSVAHTAENTKPNIVFILADDMGIGDTSSYGGTMAKTPHLERFAKEGTRFTRYYSASPICSPSRCGLITGQFPARWNVTSYLQTKAGNKECEQADFLDSKAPSLPRVLKSAGYATAHIGKWHLGGGRDVVDPPKFAAYGYDMGLGTYESPEPAAELGLKTFPWGPDNKREPQQVARHERTKWMVDQTIGFLKKHQGTPCFVNLWLDDTHGPWVPAEAKQIKDAGKTNLIKVIEEMDRQIGRLMDAVPENTLLIFATDNGPLPTFEAQRNNGLRGSKLSLYEGGIRLPFIARWKGHVPAGGLDEMTVIHAVDMLPTFSAIGQAKLPEGYKADGENLADAILGKSTARTKPLFWEYGRNATSFSYPTGNDRSPNVAMLDGTWKLLINADGTQPELYDLKADPNEIRSLVDEQPERAASMKAAALAWRQSLPKLP
jgi:arylsulfatase A-like enzyme